MDFVKVVAVLLLFRMSVCNSYRILAIFPFQGRSHISVLQTITKALARKGHEVDVISHYPLREPMPNYRDIIRLSETVEPRSINYTIMTTKDKTTLFSLVRAELCEQLGRPDMMRLIENLRTDPYDLFLIHYSCGEICFHALGYITNRPVVTVVTTSLYPPSNSFIDNPLNLAISPNNLVSCENENMTFWDRLNNVIMTYWEIYQHYSIVQIETDIVRKYLGHDMPDVRELEKSVDAVLTNSHHSYHGIKPKSPGLIEIGGIHIKNDSSPIEPELKRVLDSNEEGFVYFSFGSMALIETFPEEILERFLNAFKSIASVSIIMRVKDPKLMPKSVPPNVHMYSWLPQQEILSHPKIRAFVTHGGAHGTQEAVYHSVPMICVPLFADQNYNCDILKKKKVAIKLLYQDASQQDYNSAFQEILHNKNYKEAVKKFSALFRDRPLNPTDEAIYWIEYVIRHGRYVLRSPAAHMKWWQIELIDIYAFILACILISIGLLYFIARKLIFLTSSIKRIHMEETAQISKKLN